MSAFKRRIVQAMKLRLRRDCGLSQAFCHSLHLLEHAMNNPYAIDIDASALSHIVDVLYSKMLEDYRINRYFYSRPKQEQVDALTQLLIALLLNGGREAETISHLADAAFTAAFARGNAKPSLVNNRDFAFLGTLMNGNIVGDDADQGPQLTLLCPAHSHLLRLQPIEENYDVMLALLQETLAESGIAADTAQRIMAFAESGRAGIMGRGTPIFEQDDLSAKFRTHG
jgi:truncated hemoglobin YjbI